MSLHLPKAKIKWPNILEIKAIITQNYMSKEKNISMNNNNKIKIKMNNHKIIPTKILISNKKIIFLIKIRAHILLDQDIRSIIHIKIFFL